MPHWLQAIKPPSLVFDCFSCASLSCSTSTFWRLTLSQHGELVWCVHNPLNSDMDYKKCNACMWFFRCIHTADFGLQSHPKALCRVCTEFDSREISGQEHLLLKVEYGWAWLPSGKVTAALPFHRTLPWWLGLATFPQCPHLQETKT